MFVIGLRRALWLLAGMASVLLLAVMAPASPAGPQVGRGAAPAWVDWLALPPVNPDRLRTAEGGIYDLLYDTQANIGGAQETTFRRRAMKVIDRAGLEGAAQTQIDFDPSFERLVVNRAAIWRDGRMIDRTAAANIDILRRESELDKGIVTGQRNAIIRLDDVEVGDVVDIAWSWQGISSPWPGDYFSQPDMGWSVPMALTRFRLLAPADKPLVIRQTRGLAQPTVRAANGLVEREWRVVDPVPIPAVKHAPSWWHGWPYLDLSTMKDWAMVAASGLRQFQGDQSLPAAYAARVDAIAAANADPGRRAIAALRLVQDSIRYTSLSIGLGGFVPRSPAEVVRSGFGDCKDKSQLLAVTLRRLGITAWPALTDMDDGPGLASRLPAANAFDHVIVLARIAGTDHWFDATRSHQGGTLATLASLPYGYALPMRPGQANLVGIPTPTPAAHTMTAVETYRYRKGGVALDVETDFTADEADDERAELASSGAAKVEKGYLDYYRGAYPGLVADGEMRISDDRNANRLRISESYFLPGTAPDYAKTIARLQVTADGLRGLYKDIDNPDDRTAPIVLPWAIKRAHRIVFDMPGYAINLPTLADSHGPAFDMTARAWHEGTRAIMEYSLTSKGREIPASAALDYVRQVKELEDATNWSIDVTKPGTPFDSPLIAPMLAVLLLVGLVVLGVLRRRHKRPPGSRSPAKTQLVIRHVPITRRNAA